MMTILLGRQAFEALSGIDVQLPLRHVASLSAYGSKRPFSALGIQGLLSVNAMQKTRTLRTAGMGLTAPAV